MLVRGTIWETFWFPFSGRACATLLFTRETTGTQVWAHPHRFMPTDIGSAPGSVSEPGMPATKWSCTTRSDAGDGDAQDSCEITVLAFQTFRQNILSLICMYIYVVCLSDSQLTQFRNFGLHGLPKKFTHVHQFSCIQVWAWHSHPQMFTISKVRQHSWESLSSRIYPPLDGMHHPLHLLSCSIVLLCQNMLSYR